MLKTSSKMFHVHSKWGIILESVLNFKLSSIYTHVVDLHTNFQEKYLRITSLYTILNYKVCRFGTRWRRRLLLTSNVIYIIFTLFLSILRFVWYTWDFVLPTLGTCHRSIHYLMTGWTVKLMNMQLMTSMSLFGLRRVRIHWPYWWRTIFKLFIQFYHLCINFTKFERRKIFVLFNDDRTSNELNMSKVHDLVGQPS